MGEDPSVHCRSERLAAGSLPPPLGCLLRGAAGARCRPHPAVRHNLTASAHHTAGTRPHP